MLFRPGDQVEFMSGDPARPWKRGIVVKLPVYHAELGGGVIHTTNVRICVGGDVYVVRPERKVRLVVAQRKAE